MWGLVSCTGDQRDLSSLGLWILSLLSPWVLLHRRGPASLPAPREWQPILSPAGCQYVSFFLPDVLTWNPRLALRPHLTDGKFPSSSLSLVSLVAGSGRPAQLMTLYKALTSLIKKLGGTPLTEGFTLEVSWAFGVGRRVPPAPFVSCKPVKWEAF